MGSRGGGVCDVWTWTVGLHPDKRRESWLGWVKCPRWPIRKHSHRHKGKLELLRRTCPLSPTTPRPPLSYVFSHELPMHQNLPSPEQGCTIIQEGQKKFHYSGKNYHSLFLVISLKGDIDTFPPLSACHRPESHQITECPGMLTFTQLSDRRAHRPPCFFIDLIPSRSIPSFFLLCLSLLGKCCCRKRERLLNWLGSPLKWC